MVADGDARGQGPGASAPVRDARLAVLQRPGPGEIQATPADDVV